MTRTPIRALWWLVPSSAGRTPGQAHPFDRVLALAGADVDTIEGKHAVRAVEAAWQADSGLPQRQPHPTVGGLWVYEGSFRWIPTRRLSEPLVTLDEGTWRRCSLREHEVFLRGERPLWADVAGTPNQLALPEAT